MSQRTITKIKNKQGAKLQVRLQLETQDSQKQKNTWANFFFHGAITRNINYNMRGKTYSQFADLRSASCD